jgi:hypothetical protein
MARENQFYFCEIPDVDANLPIYLFMFHEEGEGESWHNEHYFRFSNHLEEMMETAVDFFEGVSERTEPRHIARMKRKLQKYGYYKISHCEYYDCEMEMELFRPLTLNYDLHCSVSPDGSYHLF